MEAIKRTFYRQESEHGNLESRQLAIAQLFGFTTERVFELWNGAELTADEYLTLGRAPAVQVPRVVWEAEANSVKSSFIGFKPTGEYIIGNFNAAARSNWLGIEDDSVLQAPARIMTPFIRVRPRRLIQSLHASGLLDSRAKGFASKIYRSNFTTVRFVATLSYWLMVSDRAKLELEYLLSIGGYDMNSIEWASHVKRHHALVKVKRRCLTSDCLLTVEQVSEMIYLQSLACRDQYITQGQFDDEVINRARVPENYSYPGSNREQFETDFAWLITQELHATKRLGEVKTWNKFVDEAYLTLPGGSTSMPSPVKLSDCGEVVGVEGIHNNRLSGNKRLRAEIDPILHFMTFGLWVVHAFLKYEVAKVRYLYPANFSYTVLGLYIMDHMYNAFQAISGIDMGHNVFGAIAVKMDVLRMVANAFCGANCDGKGFNENHSFHDMSLVYRCCKTVSPRSDSFAYQELQSAIDKYVDSLRTRKVKLNKIGPVAESVTMDVGHTLFSGEATTQLVNTMLLFGLSVLAVRSAINAGRIERFMLFLKGDDLNGFCGNWLEACVVFHEVSSLGMLLEPAKDHVEPSQSEHERCLVSPLGYNGSIARRIGAAVAAEPQGSRGLTLEELLQTMAEHHQSMICRCADYQSVCAFSKAMLMTAMRLDSLPDYVWAAAHRPKSTGGFGLWMGQHTYFQKAGRMPRVETRIKLKPGGRFRDMGSAHMTDPLITRIAEDHRVLVSELRPARDQMVSDAVESGLGPEKYGDRREKNIRAILSFISNLPDGIERGLTLTAASASRAYELGEELNQLLDDAIELRYFKACTPAQVIERQLSRSGCVNADIYKQVYGIPKGDGDRYLRHLIQGVQRGAENEVVMGLARIPFREAKLFYLGNFDITFWRDNERINAETSALVRAYTIQKVAGAAHVWELNATRQLSATIKWEYILTGVASVVWSVCKAKLELVSF